MSQATEARCLAMTARRLAALDSHLASTARQLASIKRDWQRQLDA